MTSLSEYFKLNRYQPKWFIGDRVKGTWNKIPFVGTIYNETFLNAEEGPRITVHSDLPIKFNGTYHYMIMVKHKEIAKLK